MGVLDENSYRRRTLEDNRGTCEEIETPEVDRIG